MLKQFVHFIRGCQWFEGCHEVAIDGKTYTAVKCVDCDTYITADRLIHNRDQFRKFGRIWRLIRFAVTATAMFFLGYFVCRAQTAKADEGYPTLAECRRAEDIYRGNTYSGVRLGARLAGKPLTNNQEVKVWEETKKLVPDVAKRMKELGVYDEWVRQVLDWRIEKINDRTCEAKTLEEVQQLFEEALKYTAEKYPRLYNATKNDPVLTERFIRFFKALRNIMEEE